MAGFRIKLLVMGLVVIILVISEHKIKNCDLNSREGSLIISLYKR